MRECQNCRKKTDCQRHHIVPRSKGGTDTHSNKAWLCHDCHGLVHDVRLFSNTGLLKKSLADKKKKLEEDIEWLNNDDTEACKALNSLYEQSPEDYELMISAIDCGCLNASHIREFVERGKITVKIHKTFKKTRKEESYE